MGHSSSRVLGRMDFMRRQGQRPGEGLATTPGAREGRGAGADCGTLRLAGRWERPSTSARPGTHDVAATGWQVVLTADSARAAALARRAVREASSVRVEAREEAPCADLPPTTGASACSNAAALVLDLRFEGVRVCLHAAADPRALEGVLGAMWRLPASWTGGYVGTDLDDFVGFVNEATILHVAHAGGTSLAEAMREAVAQLGAALGRASAACVACLGPDEALRLRAFHEALDVLYAAVPGGPVQASLRGGEAAFEVVVWAAEREAADPCQSGPPCGVGGGPCRRVPPSS